MSRDTKAAAGSCIVCYRHFDEASVVPLASPVSVQAIQDKPYLPDERQGSVRLATSSIATTCASDMNEGDYETSIEGMVSKKRSDAETYGAAPKESLRNPKKKSTFSIELAKLDRSDFPIENKFILELPREPSDELAWKVPRTYNLISSPASSIRSKSWPILKSEATSDAFANLKADPALASKSSSARKKKMSTIVERMAPFISFYPATNSTANFRDQEYEARRFESKTTLSMLHGTPPTAEVINDERSEEPAAELTPRETNKDDVTDRLRRRGATPTSADGARVSTNDGDLVDVAKDPCSSINSIYFSANPRELLVAPPNDPAEPKRRHARIPSDVDALRKIENELSPLRYRYNEMIGRARALGLSGGADSFFHLDVSRLADRRDDIGRLASPNPSNCPLDRDRIFSPAAASLGTGTRSAFVGKTTPPSSTFSMVGKPTPELSRTSWSNESGGCGAKTRRQEASNFVARDRLWCRGTEENLRSSPRERGFGNSTVTRLSPTNILGASREVVSDAFGARPRTRNECFSDNNFQPCHALSSSEEVEEKDARARRKDWSARVGKVNASVSSVLRATSEREDSSCRLAPHRTVETNNSPRGSSIDVLRSKSLLPGNHLVDRSCRWSGGASRASDRSNRTESESTVVRAIDDYGRDIGDEATNCRPSDLRNSATTQTEVLVDRVVSYPLGLERSFERGATPRICRVVGVNPEFRATTVEKCYADRAVSPVANARNAAPSRSTCNVLLATVSSVFVQRVRADSSVEAFQVESGRRLVDAIKNDIYVVGDPLAAKPSTRDSRLARRDCKADLSTTLRLPKTTKRITIVLADGIPEPPKSADVDLEAISSRYAADELAPKSSRRIVPYRDRKSRGARSSFDSANKPFSEVVSRFHARLTQRESSAVGGESISRLGRSAADSYTPVHDSHYRRRVPSSRTSVVARSSRWQIRVVTAKRTREVAEEPRAVAVAKALPGMRSSPEDFLCDT